MKTEYPWYSPTHKIRHYKFFIRLCEINFEVFVAIASRYTRVYPKVSGLIYNN
jgi:hypothetical protein